MHQKIIHLAGCALALGLFMSGTAAAAESETDSDRWNWTAELYFWGASLGGNTTSGDNVDIGIDTIIDDLKFGAMGAISAHKGRWTGFADLIYLDLDDKASTAANVGPISLPVDAALELKGVVSTAGVGYQVYQKDGSALHLIGGLRYLWLEADLDLAFPELPLPLPVRPVSVDDSWTNVDAVVGLRGIADINEAWYVSYYADIGAGESDLTWQALAAINYRMKKVDLVLGYRYLDWEFDDFGPFDDLNLSGAFAGVKIPF